MAQSIFELSAEQLAAVEKALLETMYRQGWIVPSGSDLGASPMFRISMPEYMENHYKPEEHWEAYQAHVKKEEAEYVKKLLTELHEGETYQFGLRHFQRDRFQQLFSLFQAEQNFEPTERQGVWRKELQTLDYGIERVLDILVQFEDIRSLAGLEQAWLTLRYASAGGAQELWSAHLSDEMDLEASRRQIREVLDSLKAVTRDQTLIQVLQLVQESTGEIQKVDDTLLWTQIRTAGISVGIVDTNEIVVFAHRGEVDQWDRDEEFLRLTLDKPLKASILGGLRDDLADWMKSGK
jgi:hypothetical protein